MKWSLGHVPWQGGGSRDDKDIVDINQQRIDRRAEFIPCVSSVCLRLALHMREAIRAHRSLLGAVLETRWQRQAINC
jgi:hypothetical protein